MRDLLKQAAQPPENCSITFIYGLVDPRTGYVRYVGKSYKPSARLSEHLRKSQIKGRSPKNCWLRELLSVGEKPQLVLLEKTRTSEWKNAERRLIAYFRNIPDYPPLTNVTSGGDGIDAGRRYIGNNKYAVKRFPIEHPLDKSLRIIPLTKNQVALVSAHRYEDLIRFNWQALWSKAGRCYYAVRHGREGEVGYVYMHRYIAGFPEIYVDHINGNSLDNRDENLRAATSSQNGANRGKDRDNTSGYKGVAKNGKHGWMGYVSCSGVHYHCGTYRTREEAARNRDIKAIQLFGDFAVLNFPRVKYSDEEIANGPQKRIVNRLDSGFKGVHWSKSHEMWRCRISWKSKEFHLGLFPATDQGKIEAAHTYDRWVIQHRGPTAYTNFPRADYL